MESYKVQILVYAITDADAVIRSKKVGYDPFIRCIRVLPHRQGGKA